MMASWMGEQEDENLFQPRCICRHVYEADHSGLNDDLAQSAYFPLSETASWTRATLVLNAMMHNRIRSR